MKDIIKNTLSDYLKTAAQNLSDEDLHMLYKIKENGIKSLIQHVVESKDFTVMSLLNIAYALNTDNEVINSKLHDDNQKIIEEVNRLENHLIYSDILHKFYEPKNAPNLRIAMKLSDIQTHELNVKSLQDIPLIGFDTRSYINPYNNAAFDITSKTEEGSDINSLINPNERSVKTTVRMSLLSQNTWLTDSGKDHAGLSYSFSQQQIAKMGIEFVLFHELAHSAASKYSFDGKNDEAFADLCGIIQVIKNNDLSQEDAVKFVNRILLYRSEANSIAYYAINFEDETNTAHHNRYHFTQDTLLHFKEMLETAFTNIKEMPIKEQAIFAANLVIAQSMPEVDQNIKDRLCLFDKESTDIYIDEILANEKDHLQQIADYQKIPVEDVIDRIKHNVRDDPRKILDLNFHVLYKHDEDVIYEIGSFFPFGNEFVMALQNHSTANYKEVSIDRNFTHADLVKELDKKEIKRKPKL
jgi:hypothetical protein